MTSSYFFFFEPHALPEEKQHGPTLAPLLAPWIHECSFEGYSVWVFACPSSCIFLLRWQLTGDALMAWLWPLKLDQRFISSGSFRHRQRSIRTEAAIDSFGTVTGNGRGVIWPKHQLRLLDFYQKQRQRTRGLLLPSWLCFVTELGRAIQRTIQRKIYKSSQGEPFCLFFTYIKHKLLAKLTVAIVTFIHCNQLVTCLPLTRPTSSMRNRQGPNIYQMPTMRQYYPATLSDYQKKIFKLLETWHHLGSQARD